MSQIMNPPLQRWSRRDYIAAMALFVAAACVTLWQNSRLAVIWDLSYLLDSSYRIALGQMPYRDFPFVHAPLTFVMQALIIRLFGRVFIHHVLYAAVISGLGSVVAWRIAWHSLRARVPFAWLTAVLLSAPLAVLGIYCIYPHPEYDCDCIFSVLVAILLLHRCEASSCTKGFTARATLAGASLVVPLFFKQNIGLPFLLTAVIGIALILAIGFVSSGKYAGETHQNGTLLTILAAATMTVLASLALLHWTAGIGNYIHWTVTFAAQKRLPGFQDMLGVYAEPKLFWELTCIGLGILFLHPRVAAVGSAQAASFVLLSSPFVVTLVSFLRADDADDRSSVLLGLWPLVLILAAVFAIYNLRRAPRLEVLFPFLLLAAIHGTFLSQQLWGSTYAIWPLFILLLAQMIPSLKGLNSAPRSKYLIPLFASIISITLLVCGGMYAASEERLSYANLLEGPTARSTNPALAGMVARGPYLPEFDQLLAFAALEIPPQDGLILVNGEDPFYFATGRVPQFPVLLFDKTTDPYSPSEVVAIARARRIRWLIVKRSLQLKEDSTPQRDELLRQLTQDFTLYRRLENYDVYRRP